MHRLTCPCGHELVVSPRQAGTTLVCEQCQRSIDVPKLGELRQLPPAEAKREREEGGGSGLSRLRGTAFAICLLIALGVGTFSIVAAIKGFSGQLPPTVEEYIAENRGEIDAMEPYQVVAIWEEYAQAGLGKRMTPQFLYERTIQLRWRTAFYVSFVVTLAAAAATVVVARGGRKRALAD